MQIPQKEAKYSEFPELLRLSVRALEAAECPLENIVLMGGAGLEKGPVVGSRVPLLWPGVRGRRQLWSEPYHGADKLWKPNRAPSTIHLASVFSWERDERGPCPSLGGRKTSARGRHLGGISPGAWVTRQVLGSLLGYRCPMGPRFAQLQDLGLAWRLTLRPGQGLE